MARCQVINTETSSQLPQDTEVAFHLSCVRPTLFHPSTTSTFLERLETVARTIMYLLNSDGYALESLWYNSRLSIFGWREWRGVRTGRVWNQNKEEEIQTEAETEASKQTETPVDSLSVWQNREGKRKALTSKNENPHQLTRPCPAIIQRSLKIYSAAHFVWSYQKTTSFRTETFISLYKQN